MKKWIGLFILLLGFQTTMAMADNPPLDPSYARIVVYYGSFAIGGAYNIKLDDYPPVMFNAADGAAVFDVPPGPRLVRLLNAVGAFGTYKMADTIGVDIKTGQTVYIFIFETKGFRLASTQNGAANIALKKWTYTKYSLTGGAQ